MRRREFITILSSAVVAQTLAANAQKRAMVLVGFLHSGSAKPFENQVAGLREGLKEFSYVEGLNLTIEFRWAEGDYTRLPTLVADLVRRQVTVLVAAGGAQSGLAAKAATTNIPIVFVNGSDPIKIGLVTSLNRPDGNITGVSLYNVALVQKRLVLLRALIGNSATIALLVNPEFSDTALQLADVQAAARTLGQKLIVFNASNDHEIDTAFTNLVAQGADALLISGDVFLADRNARIAALTTRYKIPSISSGSYCVDGGLMSYGTNNQDMYRQAGLYVGRILNGAKPVDLPVLLPTKFVLIINMKTAKAIGVAIPDTLLALADDVIE